ncbi:MAG: hypothetical protein JWR24_1846 [Actinoallomurus sp.]|nr:hypothetical protein [Actinoallomurus sp.]
MREGVRPGRHTPRPDVTVSDLLRLTHALSVATEFAPEDTGRLLSFLLDGIRPQH